MKNLESKTIKAFEEYKGGEQPEKKGVIKLNANENPYPPSKNVMKAIKEFKSEQLRLYAEEKYSLITNALAKKHKVKADNILIGNGSDDILNMCFLAFFSKKEKILMPDISYAFYPVWSKLYEVKTKEIKIEKDFSINLNKYKNANGIIFANPNSPTGKAVSKTEIIKLLEKNKNIPIIIDEAYIEFSEGKTIQSLDTLVNKYKNIVVVRTFSKAYPLAGLRLGYAIGSKEVIKSLNKIRHGINPYPISQLTETIGSEAIKDSGYYKENIKKMNQTKKEFAKNLEKIGFEIVPSETNFLLVKHEKVKAKTLLQKLKEKNILIRHYDIEKISEYVRISIGTNKDIKKVYKEIVNIVSAKERRK